MRMLLMICGAAALLSGCVAADEDDALIPYAGEDVTAQIELDVPTRTVELGSDSLLEDIPDPEIEPEAAVEPTVSAAVIPLSEWDPAAALDDGWSTEALLEEGEAVSSVTGEAVGVVENLLLGADDRILSVVVEAGGLLDRGDIHLAVPWDSIALRDGGRVVVVPVTEDAVEDYSDFGRYGYFARSDADEVVSVEEGLTTAPRVWKITDLLDDYVVLEDRRAYGYVDDVIFDEGGRIAAVLIEPDVAYSAGPAYPYPWRIDGFVPGLGYYMLPYDEDEIAVIEPVDGAGMLDEPDE